MKKRGIIFPVTIFVLVLFIYSFSIAGEKVQPTGPYDTLRDYLAAREAMGKVLRIKKVEKINNEQD